MAVLTRVEAKSLKGRLFLGGVILALTIGGAGMVYPFLLMFSGAMRSNMDASDMTVVPKYFRDDAELVRKFLETKYNYNPTHMNRFRQSSGYSFKRSDIDLGIRPAEVADFRQFLAAAELPEHWQMLGGTRLYQGMSSETHKELIRRVRLRFKDDLAAFNVDLGAPVHSWHMIDFIPPMWEMSRTTMRRNGLMETYFEVMKDRDFAERGYVNITGYFLDRIAHVEYGMNTFEKFREATGVPSKSYAEFTLPARVPPAEQQLLRKLWLRFVFDNHLNLSFVRSDATDIEFREYVRRNFQTVEKMQQYWHDANYQSFDDVRLPGDREWVPDSQREVYKSFLQALPVESLRLVGPEYSWREFLADKYGDPASAARAHGYTCDSWDEFILPTAALETAYVVENAGMLRRRYAFRNFGIVGQQMFVQGRSFRNSITYVCLALVFSLTLQPLVAYALSRFKPKGTWKIIFIFVATMAFPPMVSMIPQFLIIKQLGLLNTFLALVLPISVSGMLIFMLKGFFDSIPKDLYDAATIDGASEFRIFWQITMAMSTPILAVVALQTFSGAWNAFLYPLIVCPDESMHVIAVWLQQFQQNATGSAVFASIIIASIPSLVIFIFAQRTIMRGIAVPSEK